MYRRPGRDETARRKRYYIRNVADEFADREPKRGGGLDIDRLTVVADSQGTGRRIDCLWIDDTRPQGRLVSNIRYPSNPGISSWAAISIQTVNPPTASSASLGSTAWTDDPTTIPSSTPGRTSVICAGTLTFPRWVVSVELGATHKLGISIAVSSADSR